MGTYTEEDLQNAIDAVNSGGMNESQSAKRYGIPRATIVGRLQGRRPRSEAYKPYQRLSGDAERDLCGWIFTQDRIGQAPTHTQVREIAETMANPITGDYRPYRTIGKNWLTGFLLRNPAVKNLGGKLRRRPATVLVDTTDETLS